MKKDRIYFNLKSFFFLLITILCFFCCTNAYGANKSQKKKGIVVLYENDVHCEIEGYSKLAMLRELIADTAWVAVTSSGDYLQGGVTGALSDGKYIVDIMRAVNYDAVTLGNHEFDFGISRLRQLVCVSSLPVTCVNFRSIAGDSLVYAPYIIRQYGSKSIAFIGVVTPSAYYTESYAFRGKDGGVDYDLCEKDVYARVQHAVDEAREKGADYVVVLSHLGEEANPQGVDSYGLVSATRGIDVVLDGHTHSVLECAMINNIDGHKVLVTQTGHKFRNVGKLFINNEGGITATLLPMDSISELGGRVPDIVQCVIDSVSTLMSGIVNNVIAYSDYPLSILDNEGRQLVRYGESNAGNIVTDALRTFCGTDLAIINGGGIRTGLNAGTVTIGNVIDMLPYGNTVTVVKITGKQLLQLLNTCCQYSPVESGSFPQVSGIRFKLLHGTNNVSDVEVLDTMKNAFVPLEMDKNYTLATIEYVITGGGMYGLLTNAKRVRKYQQTDSQTLVWYMKERLHGVLPREYATEQGRIQRK